MLLPVRLRKAVMLSWLQCLVKPVGDLYSNFSLNRNNNIYILSHNGQVAFLQAALNDTFDPSARRIYIIDGATADPLYLFLDAENHPLWLGLNSEAGVSPFPDPQWFFTNTETANNMYCFIIMVPNAIFIDLSRLRATVDRYRLPSKANYTIMGF